MISVVCNEHPNLSVARFQVLVMQLVGFEVLVMQKFVGDAELLVETLGSI